MKPPAEVPSMSGLPIDVTSVHDAVVRDRELVGLRVMSLFKQLATAKIPCSNLTGNELMADFKTKVTVELSASNRRFDELSIEEQNHLLARSIALEWGVVAEGTNKKERLVRLGRNPAKCF